MLSFLLREHMCLVCVLMSSFAELSYLLYAHELLCRAFICYETCVLMSSCAHALLFCALLSACLNVLTSSLVFTHAYCTHTNCVLMSSFTELSSFWGFVCWWALLLSSLFAWTWALAPRALLCYDMCVLMSSCAFVLFFWALLSLYALNWAHNLFFCFDT